MTDHTKRTAPLKNVIFDMGGVLMTFDGPHFARQFSDNEQDAAALQAAYFGRGEWALLDAGAIGYPTMLRIAEAHLDARLHPNLHEMATGWARYSEPIDEVNELATRLAARVLDLYLLSNAGTRIDEQLNHCPAYPLMKGRVVSAEERLMKPDPAIYELLCERYGLDPATCLFVDDNPDNCTGAEVAGMRSFRFTGDAVALERAIEGLLTI